MADKYIELSNGKQKEKEFASSSAGVGDAGKGLALDATGKLDSSVFPAGFGEETFILPASEDLTAGDFVNIYDSGSAVMKCRKADATGPGEGKKAHGFILAGVTAEGDATIYFDGINSQLAGLTPGAVNYLGKTAGGIVEDVSGYTTGNIVQEIGTAKSATELLVQMHKPTELA